MFEKIGSWMGDGFSVFVYVAIIILFIVGIMKCILPVIRTSDVLNRAVKNIKKGDKARRSWQEDRFLGRGVLMPHWSEYLNNLFFADGEYHNPSNVEDFINEETVIDGPGSTHLAEAVPGVAVSLGFLGTLMGLSVSLSNMSGVDAQAVSESMSVLLGSMKYAFLTSIFGVVVSILFTLLTRIVRSRAERSLTAFYNAMARYAGVLSVDPMTQIAIYQQEQTGLLKQLLEKLDSEKSAKAISDAVGASIRPLANAVEKNMDLVSTRQAQLMDDVAQAYIQRMDQALHGQLDHFANTVENTCRQQERAVRGMSEAMNGLSDVSRAVREMKTDMDEVLKRLEATLHRLAQAQARYEDLFTRTEGVVEQQAGYMDALSGLNDEFIRQTEVLHSAMAEFMNNANSLTDANCAGLENAAGVLEEAGESLSRSMQNARDKLNRDMEESLNYFEGCMTEILKRIEWAANETRDAVCELPEKVEGAVNGYLSEIDTLTDALMESREKIERAISAQNLQEG